MRYRLASASLGLGSVSAYRFQRVGWPPLSLTKYAWSNVLDVQGEAPSPLALPVLPAQVASVGRADSLKSFAPGPSDISATALAFSHSATGAPPPSNLRHLLQA